MMRHIDNRSLVPFGLVLGLLIGGGLWLHWPHLTTLVWSSDEGIHLSAAYLVAQGKEPYRTVSFSQGPLFLELVRLPLVWGMHIDQNIGNDVTAVRVALLNFGVLLLVATALIGRDLWNNLAGWGAALALLAMPSFFYFSRAVMADLPAVALGMWAAWAAIRFVAGGDRRWLLGSGILLGLSLATKFLTIYALGWIGLLLLYRIWYSEREAGWRRQLAHTLRDGLLFGGSTLLTVLAIYLWYDLPALLKSAFGMRVAMREAFGNWVPTNRDEVAEFWTFHAPLILLAGYGLFAAAWRTHAKSALDADLRGSPRMMHDSAGDKRKQERKWGSNLHSAHHLRRLLDDEQRLFLLVSWLLLAALSLRVQNPLYHQHLQLLLPILALLAGLGIALLVDQLYCVCNQTRRFYLNKNAGFDSERRIEALGHQPLSVYRAGIIALGLVLVGWLLIFTITSYRTPNRYTEISLTGLREDQMPIVEFLQKFTAPGDCVVTDDLNLAFISRRFPPPQLIDLSSARLATESINDARLVTLTQRAGCQVVAPLTDRIVELSPGFDQWSQETFLGQWQGEEDAQLWLAQPLAHGQPTIPLQKTLGDQVLLQGADLVPDPAHHTLHVSLYWQTLTSLPIDYKVFVHLRDETNTTLVNGDHLPYDNLVPTTRWPVGSVLKETIRLDLPPDLTPGTYQLFLGMYDPASQERLPVLGDTSGENAVVLPLVWARMLDKGFAFSS